MCISAAESWSIEADARMGRSEGGAGPQNDAQLLSGFWAQPADGRLLP
jgi:hypothetical protein